MARDSLGSCSSKSPASSREATEDVISFKTVDAPPTPASRLEPEPTVPLANITSRRERRGLRKGALKGGALRGGAKRVTKVEAGTPDSLVDVSQPNDACNEDPKFEVDTTSNTNLSISSGGGTLSSLSSSSNENSETLVSLKVAAPTNSSPVAQDETLVSLKAPVRANLPPPAPAVAPPPPAPVAAVNPKPVCDAPASASRQPKSRPMAMIEVNGVSYNVLQMIGKGGSSKVYKVMSPDHKIYALKRCETGDLDPMAAECFMEEISLLKRLAGSKTVVEIVDSEILEDMILVVMEVGEIDLWKLLREHDGGLPENYLRLYWQQMLEAVHTVHEEKIIHSDLKPANFLCVRGMLKLIDFGIARALQSDATSMICEKQMGTLNYMSPEAINSNNAAFGGSKIGRASDVWSLGCILYEMTFGEPPFAKIKNLVQKIQAITNPAFEVTFDESCTDTDLKELILSCLNREPHMRPTIPKLLEHVFLHPNRKIQAQADTKVEAPAAAPVNVDALASIMPVLQKLAAANIAVDAAAMALLSQEIGEQLEQHGSVNMSELTIMKQATPKPVPVGKGIVVDKENMPPPQGHNNKRAAPTGLQDELRNFSRSSLKASSKTNRTADAAPAPLMCLKEKIEQGVKQRLASTGPEVTDNTWSNW